MSGERKILLAEPHGFCAGVRRAVALAEKALAALPGDEAWFPSADALKEHLAAHPVRDAVVLIKGSHSISMEKVIPSL